MGRPDHPRRQHDALPDKESALAACWKDIVTSLETHPEGFKKAALTELSRQAFERAVAALRAAFGIPQAMIDAIRADAVPLPEGADHEHLLRFAGRWKTHEESRARIAAEGDGAKRELGTILVAHGTRDGALRTQEEEAKRRADKKRNRKKE